MSLWGVKVLVNRDAVSICCNFVHIKVSKDIIQNLKLKSTVKKQFTSCDN